MQEKVMHKDFGEKIGGARKDLWKDRGLCTDDLTAMNAREAEKFVKKDNVWKKPDYQAMCDSGIPLGVVYFVKIARDSIGVAPNYDFANTPERKERAQRKYVETVKQLKDVLMGVRTVEDVLRLRDEFVIPNMYVSKERSYGGRMCYQVTEEAYKNPAITTKLLQNLIVGSEIEFDRRFTRKAKQTGFLVAKEQKVPAGYEVRFCSGETGKYYGDGWIPNTYYVVHKHRIVKEGFQTAGEAIAFAQEDAKQRRNVNKKTRVTPPQLENVRRTGPDYRNDADVTGEDYLETFGFRGGEFGNWLNQNDRQASLNMGYDALKDLASVLGIDDGGISFNGELAIAFGARGNGNAAAHYEPMRKVINLTKMNGAGSLAHEWWHAFDDYMGGVHGKKGYLTADPKGNELFEKLVDAMKYRQQTQEEADATYADALNRMQTAAESWLKSIVWNPLQNAENEEALKQYEAFREEFLRGVNGSVDKMNALCKEVVGRSMTKSERERLLLYENLLHMKTEEAPKPGRARTDYLINSIQMDASCEKDGDYWQSTVEMSARAFACYVLDRLPYQSDYLCGHAESAVALATGKDGKTSVLKAYPEGDDRKTINAVFDEIFAWVRENGML